MEPNETAEIAFVFPTPVVTATVMQGEQDLEAVWFDDVFNEVREPVRLDVRKTKR